MATQNVRLGAGQLTGIEDILDRESDDSPVEYYNLQGIKIENELPAGVYIRRHGKKAEKVIIRY